jgi:hypothetical protein
LSVVPQNRRSIKTAWGTHRDLATCFAGKQVRLEFFSLTSKLMDARQRVVHVTPSRRSHEDQVKDRRVNAMGYVGACYPYFTIFDVLDTIDILVF